MIAKFGEGGQCDRRVQHAGQRSWMSWERARGRTRGGAEVRFPGVAEEPTEGTMVGFRCSSSTACAGNPRGRFPE